MLKISTILSALLAAAALLSAPIAGAQDAKAPPASSRSQAREITPDEAKATPAQPLKRTPLYNRIAMAKVVTERRHLGLIGVGDNERCRAR